MKFKHIIGLDVGTNSLGWSLIKEFEDGTIEIVKTGVHIFPIGTIVDDKSNKEKTKNEQRRSYRGASRMRYRFKLRRNNLKQKLDNLGMLPDYSKLFKPFSKKEKKTVSNFERTQSFELYKLRANAINPEIQIPLQEIGRVFMLLNKYRGFKSNAKKLQQKDSEAGKVKKGYESLQQLIDKSGAETIGEYFFKMHEKANQWYAENKWHNPNEPIDERAFNDIGEFVLFNSNGIRRHHGRYTLRDMYTNEFDKIWAAQRKHYSDIFTGSKEEYDLIIQLPYSERIKALKEFKKTNYWYIRDYCIYYQRPLKSQKKYVSNCQFENGEFELQKYTIKDNNIEKEKEKRIWKKKAKKACPKSHPYFQEFRIWQKLHQIKYLSVAEDVYKRESLKPEWLPVLVEALMQNFELFLNKTPKVLKENKLWFSKILHQKGLIQDLEGYNFHIDKTDEDIDHEEKNENRITGNVTYSSFLEVLGVETFNRLKNETTTRIEQVSKDEVLEIKDSKLFLLWHHLYIAKDGLFKEEDWLRCILTESTKWNFTPEQSQRLIEMGLQPDYASYSSKVLKAILPEMRKGVNEYEALKAINKGYVNEDNTIGEQVKLKEKISQLNYQELRNPVVERALSKTIKLVNTILEKYKSDIDRETFEIRIESTRQFRKPRQERENERRKNADKDKLREQYATYLTKNKDKLGFKGDIYKYNSIIAKYELWLQMNMNEDDETFINEFKSFSKITKQEDKIKHKLWLECGRMCPYTGNIINLTDCFSSEVEIEHIIPLSRSLDDSFNNKTLTYSHTNAAKANMTPLEYLEKLGGSALKDFKARLKSKINDFSDNKKDLFLAENIKSDFSSNQIANTSYIAKYTRQKMWEVCKKQNVQFTNGSATSELRNKDWSLSNLLDKIRYEEDYKINIDDYYKQYYSLKKDFVEWYKKQYNSTDFTIKWDSISENEDVRKYITETNNDILFWDEGIKAFNNFRNTSGKKDRSDHRHHAVDAFVTACCSPKIIKALSTFNAAKEEQHLDYRDKVDKQFNYGQLKESIAAILVSHSEKQTLIKKRKNKIKTKEGIIEHITYAPQGKLHEESFYAKRNGATVRRVQLFNEQSTDKKTLYEKASDLDYSVKGTVKWNYIEDKELYQITKNRLEKLEKKAFTKEQMEDNPFYRVSPKTPDNITSKKNNKPLPIVKSIRKRFNADDKLINLPSKDEDGNIITENRFADNESNSMIILYENIKLDKKGNYIKPERHYEVLSFFKSVGLKNTKNKRYYVDGKLFKDEKNNIGLNSDCQWLKQGDVIALYIDEKDKEKMTWDNNLFLKKRLYKVKGFFTPPPQLISGKEYQYGYISLMRIDTNKSSKYPSKKDVEIAIEDKDFSLSHVKLNAIKIRLNILGEIEAKGEECF
jgi:CRISPR-associated endonuclease Csn1